MKQDESTVNDPSSPEHPGDRSLPLESSDSECAQMDTGELWGSPLDQGNPSTSEENVGNLYHDAVCSGCGGQRSAPSGQEGTPLPVKRARSKRVTVGTKVQAHEANTTTKQELSHGGQTTYIHPCSRCVRNSKSGGKQPREEADTPFQTPGPSVVGLPVKAFSETGMSPESPNKRRLLGLACDCPCHS